MTTKQTMTTKPNPFRLSLTSDAVFRCVECRTYYRGEMFYTNPPEDSDGTYYSGICDCCAEKYRPEIRHINPARLLGFIAGLLAMAAILVGVMIALNL